MPDYLITDPASGRILQVTGKHRPSQSESAHLFKVMAAKTPAEKRAAREPQRVTPNSIFGAARGAASAGMAHLVDQPGDLRGAASAAGGELQDIGLGKAPLTPSEVLKSRGVPSNTAADLMMDTVLDPLNAVAGGEDVVQSNIKGVLEHAPQLVQHTHRLYATLLTEILPRLNKPTSGQALVAMLREHGLEAAAKIVGLREWLIKQGDKLLTRAALVARLMQDRAFRKVIMEHAPALARPGTLVSDYTERSAAPSPSADDQEAPSLGRLLSAILPAAAAVYGTHPDWKIARPGLRLFDAAEMSGNTKPLAPPRDELQIKEP